MFICIGYSLYQTSAIEKDSHHKTTLLEYTTTLILRFEEYCMYIIHVTFFSSALRMRQHYLLKVLNTVWQTHFGISRYAWQTHFSINTYFHAILHLCKRYLIQGKVNVCTLDWEWERNFGIFRGREGMENFQRQGRNFLGGRIKFFCIGQGGTSK